MSVDAPVRITEIQVEIKANQPDGPPLTFDGLETAMDLAVKDGFEGALLVTQGGEIVFAKGFGFANRELMLKNNIDTVFGIGSQPIDFTHVAILQLKDQGKLQLSDLISKFFSDVPDDKKTITIEHLMNGQSGFPDFHDLPTDQNKDHSWIDRDEAIRRMFDHKLLFAPGKGEAHSHSAWGMLAAIVEIASGQTYQNYTTQNLFKPAGMVDTGFYGDDVSENRVAVGYGALKSSEPNSPPHWGKTSWLVMGSGGQVSTLPDLLRWEQAVHDGKLLSAESTQYFLRRHKGLALDGSMFGFEFMHSYDPNSLFMLISNAVETKEKRQRFKELGQRLHQLIAGRSTTGGAAPEPRTVQSKFSLGILLEETSSGVPVISQVVPGSAAERDGLKVGDKLISANGRLFEDDPVRLLQSVLSEGKQISFEIERSGKSIELRVTPNPR